MPRTGGQICSQTCPPQSRWTGGGARRDQPLSEAARLGGRPCGIRPNHRRVAGQQPVGAPLPSLTTHPPELPT
jgi:hypothetical protein